MSDNLRFKFNLLDYYIKFKMTNQNILLIMGLLTIFRHLVLKFAPQLIVSAYITMFVIAFALSLIIGQSIKIALLIGLIITVGRLIYRYNTNPDVLEDGTGIINTMLFVVGLIMIVVMTPLLIPFTDSIGVNWGIYGLVAYIMASLFEWFSHKYVMHCFQYMKWLEHIPHSHFIFGRFAQNCHHHKQHHMSVNPNMTLNHVENKYELVFGWSTLILATILIALGMIPVISLLNLQITLKQNLLFTSSMALIFGLVWNSIHPKMHDHPVPNSVSEAPPNIGIPTPPTNLYYRNHEIHHQVKGDRKGNYNVVFLGADELLDTNRLVR